MPKRPTWTHPELGLFTHDDTGWEREFPLPGLQAFRYDWLGRLRTRKSVRLIFDAVEDDDGEIPLPSKQTIAIAQRTMKNEQLLADRILKAMWDELHGRGPETGMWWHGDLPTINEWIASSFSKSKKEPPALTSPEALYDLMGPTEIRVLEQTYLYEKPCAMINFAAAFDDEHGAGVLTDGTRVLGIGYQNDATPFR